MSARARATVGLVALALVATACGGDGGGGPNTSAQPTAGQPDPSTFVAQVATSDLYVDAPLRVAVGVFANDPAVGVRLVTSGTVDVAFAPFEDGPGTEVQREARYLPAPGTQVGDGPTLADPATARGVYEAAEVAFDGPGVWEATVTFTVDGQGPFTVTATPFQVQKHPAYPAPGDKALRTENLTMDSDAPPEAIDSRALDGAPIPDPELHEWTIADAIDQGRPVLALFATPTFCDSLFCGPVTDALQALATEHEDRAAFIHVEVWREHPTVLNEGAADWLYRDGNLTEPWLYLIDGRGRIVDRWSPLFDVDEVAGMLEDLPAIET
jgi:hypothetical protein